MMLYLYQKIFYFKYKDDMKEVYWTECDYSV